MLEPADPLFVSSVFDPSLWDRVSAGDVVWKVDPYWREALLDVQGLRWEQWRAEGRLLTVKTGPHRAVYRVETPQGAVYIKHFRVPDWRYKIRQWFRKGKGHNEAHRAVELNRIGVQTIAPIALGEQRKLGFLFENYLVTREIPDMEPLDEVIENRMPSMPPEQEARLRRDLAYAMADLTARLHQANLVHDDFHPGNVLMGWNDSGRPRLAMIDLDALRVGRNLTWSDIKINLAKLDHYFWVRSERSDRYRFLLAYLKARESLAGHLFHNPDQTETNPRNLSRQIEQATRDWAEKLWNRWGARCRGTNKYFRQKQESSGWSIASRSLSPEDVSNLLNDPEAPFRDPNRKTLKASRTASVIEMPFVVKGQTVSVVYKRFEVRQRLEPFLAVFRPTRCWRAWQAAQHLTSRAVPTPANLAILTRTNFLGLPKEQYLMVVKADPSMDVANYLRKRWAFFDVEEKRDSIRRLTASLARLIRTMHERSVSNRDLKTANILILESENKAEVLSLIDLVGVQIAHPLPWDRRVQNLARLWVSVMSVGGITRTDALRFLRDYLPWGLVSRNDWKRLWRDVAARCDDKLEQNRRRGRKIS